jgi:hypothetical protein
MKSAHLSRNNLEKTSFLIALTNDEYSNLLFQMAESVIHQIDVLDSRLQNTGLFSQNALESEIVRLENSFVRFLYDSAITASKCFELSGSRFTTIIRALNDYQRFKINTLRRCKDENMREHYKKDVFAKIDWANINFTFQGMIID